MLKYQNKKEIASLDNGKYKGYSMRVKEGDTLPDGESTLLKAGGYVCYGYEENTEKERQEFKRECDRIERTLKRFGGIARPSKKFAPGRDLNR